MHDFNRLRSELPDHGLTYLAEIPYVYHCHHFNLFHDQSLEDALGEARAIELKTRAAEEAFSGLLESLAQAFGATTPAERLELATAVFPWMGQGRMSFSVTADGGSARGEYLHYSYAWREKYGAKVKRLDPLDGVAAGFTAAAAQEAFGLATGSLTVREESCYAMRASHCDFQVGSGEMGSPVSAADKGMQATFVGPALVGQDEERIATIAAGLREFLTGVGGDERGLIPAFNVFVTMHLPTYYNRTAFDALHFIEESVPASLPAAEGLLGESGHVCVFYTFGNILLSPEWEALVGPLSGDPEDTVSFCCAIARGLGFGHWSIGEFVPGERLVLRASANYEAPYYLQRYGPSEKPRCLFFANAARAIMQLAHRVDLASKPLLTEELYQSLFKGGAAWHMEQTQCLTKGDDLCEVVVTKV